jgi:hypothetical protein
MVDIVLLGSYLLRNPSSDLFVQNTTAEKIIFDLGERNGILFRQQQTFRVESPEYRPSGSDEVANTFS